MPWRQILRWGLRGLGLSLGLSAVLAAAWALIFPDAARYLWQSAEGQAELLLTGKPVSEVLENPGSPAQLKQQLRLVQQVKAFAEKELQLKPTQNYSRYVDLQRDYLVMVLTASPPLSFGGYTWWFPIVGTVPYKGFFDLEMGKAEESKLQDEGYETHFRPAPAYSTLGWFHDPLLSTMFGYGENYLINTVIHESVHATHWVPGEVTFNENMASFIGNQGALAFYAHTYGKGSDKYQNALQKLADQKVFAAFINRVYDELNAIYTSDRFEANKAEDKVATIQKLKQIYVQEVLPQIRSQGYAGFEKQEWNNALILSYRHYNQDQEKLETIFNKLEQSIPQMMAFLQQKDVLKYFREE
ncbi:MAG: aminopeptidase [Candidatus Sericytochromatia bacterium]|nr:aminopeptidase [Candidatus Sericytochromatia bacterium]